MAAVKCVIAALLLACASAQFPVQGFFNVPATAFNPGGRVNFAGFSLGQICRELLRFGGKEALSDGMGMAAKWFANQKISSDIAGGNDPQMQCLYSQATGGMMPGVTGTRDPGNMFGDYYDTAIEYPVDPCGSPQCNGKVNPVALLMQTYAPMMRPGMAGGMAGGFPGAGNPFGALGQNPLLSAMMPNQQPAVPATPAAAANATNQTVPAATNPAVSTNVAQPAATPQLPGNPMGNMLQNPQFQQMMMQFMQQMMMRPGGGPVQRPPNAVAPGFPAFPPFGNLNGLPGGMFF